MKFSRCPWLIVLFVAFFFATKSNAQLQWTKLGGETFNDLVYSPLLQPIAIGNEGKILLSKDSGVTWSLIPSGVYDNLYSIRFSNDSRGLIAGTNGLILRSIDTGRTWNRCFSHTKNHLRNITFVSRDTAFICGDKGTLLRSINAGKTWSDVQTPTDKNLSKLAFSNGWGFIVGSSGTHLRSTNNGRNWLAVNLTAHNDLTSISFLNNGLGIIVGDSGTVYVTRDNGYSWIPRATASSFAFKEVKWIAYDKIYALSDSNHVYRSSDSGSSWIAITLEEHRPEYKLSTFTFYGSSGLMVGAPGLILHTSNGGDNWEVQAQSPFWIDTLRYSYFSQLKALNDREIIGLAGNRIYRSIDRGVTWNFTELPYQTQLYGCDFQNALEGIIIGSNGFVARTSDGGLSFEKLTTPKFDKDQLDKDLLQVQLFNLKGYLLSTDHLYLSNDGGMTWQITPVAQDSGILLKSFSFPTPQIGYIIAGRDPYYNGMMYADTAIIFQTVDGGLTWSRTTLPMYQELTKAFFFNSFQGYVCGNQGLILYTEDGGNSWQTRSQHLPFQLTDIVFTSDSDGMAIGDGFNIMTTRNAGKFWRWEFIWQLFKERYKYLSSVEVVGDTTILVWGRNCLYLCSDLQVSSIRMIRRPRTGNTPPLPFTIAVQPNPITRSAKVTLTNLEEGSEVEFLKVYDEAGREISDLTNTINYSGTTASATINASNLSIGAYTLVAKSSTGGAVYKIIVLRDN